MNPYENLRNYLSEKPWDNWQHAVKNLQTLGFPYNIAYGIVYHFQMEMSFNDPEQVMDWYPYLAQ